MIPRTRLNEMARNPFNLSLLVAAYKSNEREMSNRGRLLEWLVDNLFSREEKLAHRGWLPRDVQTRACRSWLTPCSSRAKAHPGLQDGESRAATNG